MGRLAHGLPPPHGRRSVAADVPARLAQRLQRSRPHDHEQRRLCGRRATKRAAGERLARRSSRCEHFTAPGIQRPGSGLGGCPGWRSGRRRTERSAAQRPASRSVRQAGLAHAQREGNRARDPRARERAAACLSRLCRPDRVRVRDGSPSGARRRYPGGSTRSATARPRAAGRRPGPQRPGGSAIAAIHAFSACSTQRSSLGSSGPVLRNKRRI